MSNTLSKINFDGNDLVITDTKTKTDLQNLKKYVFYKDKDSDITNDLQSALKTYKYVTIVGGPYTISKSIVVPYGSTLDGNGTTINCTSKITTWAFILYDIENMWKNPKEKTGITNLNVQCNRYCSGIDIAIAGVTLNGVLVQDVKSDGTGFAIFPGENEAKSSDVNIINCGVYNNLDLEYTCKYGLEVWELDNTINNFKTIGTVNGVRIRKNGGGTYLFECHPLACDSSLSEWVGSKGFWIEADTTLVNCYNDNFNYGIYTNGQQVRGVNFFSNYYETNRKTQRYIYYGTTDELHLHILNIKPVPHAITIGGSVQLNITKPTSCFYSVESDAANTPLIVNDPGFDIYAHGGMYTIVPEDQQKGYAPIIAIAPLNSYRTMYSPINIMCGQFAIMDLLIKQTSGNAVVLDWGRLVKNSTELSNTISVKITMHNRADNLSWLSVDSTDGTSYIGAYSINCKSGILYLPTYIKTTDFGTDASSNSHTYSA